MPAEQLECDGPKTSRVAVSGVLAAWALVAEVGEHGGAVGAAVAHQHVRRDDGAVGHPTPGGMIERLGDVAEDRHDERQRQWRAVGPAVEQAA